MARARHVVNDGLQHAQQLARSAFEPNTAMRIGAEVEWLVYAAHDFTAPISALTSAAAAEGPLPAGGTVSIEPGGQLELSSLPHSSPDKLLEALALDTAVLVARFRARGLALVSLGLDPIRPSERTLDIAKYAAMERFFDHWSPAGVDMMCRTASLQINIDFGDDVGGTWRRAHTVAPALLIAFANSPTQDGTTMSAISHRQLIWDATESSRTRLFDPSAAAWVAAVLDAQVMFENGSEPLRPELAALSLRDWLATESPPTLAQVEEHITTLFPPIRPKGYVELRMFDALPPEGRAAAVRLTWRLFTDPQAGAAAELLCQEVADFWPRALEHGAEDHQLRAVSQRILSLGDHSACNAWAARFAKLEHPRGATELIVGLIES